MLNFVNIKSAKPCHCELLACYCCYCNFCMCVSVSCFWEHEMSTVYWDVCYTFCRDTGLTDVSIWWSHTEALAYGSRVFTLSQCFRTNKSVIDFYKTHFSLNRYQDWTLSSVWLCVLLVCLRIFVVVWSVHDVLHTEPMFSAICLP